MSADVCLPTRQRSLTASRLLRRVAAALVPPPKRWPDEWADQCRILPPGCAEPGPFRSSRTPYMVPIVRAMADARYRRVVVCCGSQMGKTDGLLNAIGARLDDDPVAMIYVGPTRSFVESQLEPRLMAMIRSAPTLRAKLGGGKSANLKTRKHIAGVTVRLAWAGSATELSSQAAGLALVDERDRMESDVAGEGDPGELLAARGATFPDFTLVVTSTPTKGNAETAVDPETGIEHWKVADPEDIESPTWRLWQEGTRHEWAWPCPDCGEYFVPRLQHLKWPKDASLARSAREARLCCPRCGSLIPDAAKAGMNARGRFVAPGQKIEAAGTVVGPAPEGDTATFWVSGIASPWVSWPARVRAFLLAARSGDPGRVQGVINTGFGELYRTIGGEERPWEAVAALRDAYRFDQVPEAVRLLTCGVDVQGDRLYFVVRGWAPRHESWLIRHGVLHGATDNPDGDAWAELEGVLFRDFSGHRIAMMAIDSGFAPGDGGQRRDHAVYLFARRHTATVMATKGQSAMAAPLKPSFIDISVSGRTVQRGLRLWHVDSDHMKSWVVQRLSWPKGDPGSFHIPADASDDYCRQLTAERRIVKPSGRALWVRVRRENHYLDCEALAFAAAMRMKVHTLEVAPVTPRQSVVRSKWLERNSGL